MIVVGAIFEISDSTGIHVCSEIGTDCASSFGLRIVFSIDIASNSTISDSCSW
ncbi:MAG: hypothetical protein KKG04_03650 [Candidatus Thermoplasmatota archaeon]|nr:hypothetical protein [Candidatus Thermoplasmatota archaeon]